MESPSNWKHLRDILLMPFTVTFIIPYLLYDSRDPFIPHSITTKLIGWLIAVAGSALFVYTVFLFKMMGQGTLAPWEPTKKLIVEGPYRYCRNPMITGVFFMLIGESIYFWSSTLLTYTLVFFVINTIYFILVEEPGLMEQFGTDYRDYKTHVPRWFPRLKPYSHLEIDNSLKQNFLWKTTY